MVAGLLDRRKNGTKKQKRNSSWPFGGAEGKGKEPTLGGVWVGGGVLLFFDEGLGVGWVLDPAKPA